MKPFWLIGLSLAIVSLCLSMGGIEVRAQVAAHQVVLLDGTVINALPLHDMDARFLDLGNNARVERSRVSLICPDDCKGAPTESFTQDLIMSTDGGRRFGRISIIKGYPNYYLKLSGKRIDFARVRYIKLAELMSKSEQELRELEEKRRVAIKQRDQRVLDEIYAPDFRAISGSGQVIGKIELMSILKSGDPRINFSTDEIDVRVFGDFAVFTGRLMGKTPAGEVVGASRFTHVFVKRGGRWQCVAGQSTPLPK